ncbi:hypothetical protein G195_005207 [Phytophthora kernoviae 00238/432]|uniref:Hexose transporter 1 n=1 Tax=Phytophthora kernoviae 00238/432 TaxID=1284355 RepID=A0A8J4S6D6_9STRA|nr:hypothetical protein G195_005207 [Phytophthora kernoviae 00238/432]
MPTTAKSPVASPVAKGSAYVEVTTPQTQLNGNTVLEPEAVEARMNIKPTYILYTSAMLAFVLPLQYGWSTSQLNLHKFNNVEDCNARPVAEDTCIMFPGHTKFQWTVVVNAWIVGGMVGAAFVGKFADRIGRKQVLVYNCGFIIAGAIVQAVVSNLWIFAVGRFLAGIASGATTGNVGGYINEISPPHLRSLLGSVLHSGITVGILLVATTFFYMDFENGWRYIAAFPIVLAAIFLSMSPFLMVESPVWLLLKGRRTEAEAVLTRLFGAENVPVALEWIESKRKHDMEMQSSTWSETGNEVVRSGNGVPFSELISLPLRRQFIIAIGIACMQKITGINTVFYYSSDLFNDAGLSNARVSTVLIDIVNMLPTLVSGVFSRRFGIRRMLLIGVAGMFVSAIGVTLSLSFSWSALSIVFIATYVGSFGVSLGPLMYVVIADIFPDYARATVSSIGVMVAWFANLVVGVGYPYISSALDNLAYLPFVVLLAISFVFLFVLLPETSGKTNEEIQDEFRAILSKDSAYVEATTPDTDTVHMGQNAAEARMHVQPTYILYTSAMLAFVLPLQFGWSTSQLNLHKFNNVEDCNARPVAEDTCIMFPGHTKFQWTVVVNAWIVGGMVGAAFVGKFADRIGRKQVLVYNCGFIIAGAIVQAVVSNLWIFAVGRFLAGIASGATTGNVGGYINEISPPHLLSLLGSVLHSGITVGILLVATTFFYMDFENGWRYIAAFPIVLAAIFLSMSPFLMVESPVWLLLKGRRTEAEAVLTRLFGAENVPVALEWIESKRKHDMEMQSSTWSETGNEVVRSGNGVPFSELISLPLRRQFIIAIGIACMQKITGINTVFYYSSDLFNDAGLSNARVSTVLIDIVNMLPTLVSGFFSRRFGIRRMLLIGVAGMFVSAIGVTLSLSFSWSALSIVFIATYVGSFGVSLGPLMYVVIADIFPDYARATVSSIGVMVAWFANLVVGVGYPYISSALDNLAYLPFVVLLAISFVFLFVLLPETSGKTNEEIQDEFRAIRRKHGARD